MKQSGLGREGARRASKPSPMSNTSAATGPEPAPSGEIHAHQRPARPVGPRVASSTPPPISPSMRAARRPARMITGGEGVYIEDRDGNRLLDAFAGLYCVNVGYGRTEIADAIAAQAREAGLLPRLCRPRHRSLDHARQDDPRPRAANMSKVYFGLAGRTPTRPTSSWSGTTTTSSAGPRRRRSSRAGAAITAPA
jgi:hypothetical protein